jgi:epoxyqueuosine reductase
MAAMANDEPLIRGHAAWALGQIATPGAMGSLEQSLVSEGDDYVRKEIQAAIKQAGQKTAPASN